MKGSTCRRAVIYGACKGVSCLASRNDVVSFLLRNMWRKKCKVFCLFVYGSAASATLLLHDALQGATCCRTLLAGSSIIAQRRAWGQINTVNLFGFCASLGEPQQPRLQFRRIHFSPWLGTVAFVLGGPDRSWRSTLASKAMQCHRRSMETLLLF